MATPTKSPAGGATKAAAALRIQNDLRSLKKTPLDGVYVELKDDSNLFEWKIWFEGPKDTPFSGGIFEAKMKFPDNYPEGPPDLYIESEFWHPNVYADGKLCISILHTPGEDPLNDGESEMMRWLPTHSFSTIFNSFLSILDDPGGAPANVDANAQYNRDRAGYMKKVQMLSAKAREKCQQEIVKKIPHPHDPNDPSYAARIRQEKEAAGIVEEPNLGDFEVEFEGGYDDGDMDFEDYGEDDYDYDQDE